MTAQEFINVTSRAETYYGKEYTNDQKKIMYDMLKTWTLKDYAKAITYCIENCKYLPKIADLKQFKADYKPNYKPEQDNFNYIDCKKCNKGFISYYKPFEKYKYEYIALCTCENGQERKRQGCQYNFITEI